MSKRALSLILLFAAFVCFGIYQPVKAQRDNSIKNSSGENYVASPPSANGIREIVPPKYQRRYNEWKAEFLSTEIGRIQWNMYRNHPNFLLTITVSGESTQGAGSGGYKWNKNGDLIAATIVLGERINEGYPSAVYYPVMNALEPFESRQLINGSVLAATKLAHEFGHVIKISTIPGDLYHLQLQLVPIYNKIFLSNGYNTKDPRLLELAQQMGGNPVQIWEDREYWGEANAMLFLRDRFAGEKLHCRLFGKIKRAVEEYAKNYEERFAEIAKSQGATYSCSWR